MLKKNDLKNLLYIQDNKPCNEQTVKGLFRAIVEPVLECGVQSIVMCRLEDKSKKEFDGILKRLEYSNADVYDFSDISLCGKFEHALKEKIWNKTEFIYVLAERYGAVFVFDYEQCEVDGFAQVYVLYNSKNLSDAFNMINLNSDKDLSDYQEKWHPDRRDNDLLNSSIRKILENLNDMNQEVIISEIEKKEIQNNSEEAVKMNLILKNSNSVAHEIRNQLSICDLYSNIIHKHMDKTNTDESTLNSIKNALDSIQKSVKLANNSLLELKSFKKTSLKRVGVKPLVQNAVELAKIYSQGKNIEINTDNSEDVFVLADENKLCAVLINLIKNAIESIEETGKVTIENKTDSERVGIIVSNTGRAIEKNLHDKIFETGFTTKKTGSGLGLGICKQSVEEQKGFLRLIKSDEISTDFEITLQKG